ncbi:transposable element Tc1 transposase [Trichonephila clavipes]|nr:transposable element Tc1 transposase [Trichonephila clavipes]
MQGQEQEYEVYKLSNETGSVVFDLETLGKWDMEGRLGHNATEAFAKLQQAYGDSVLSRAQVFRWFKAFSDGRESIEDEPRGRRPSVSKTTENVVGVRDLVHSDRRLTNHWNDEHQTTRKTGSGRWKVTSARDDGHLLRMALNDHTASSKQLAARWSTAISVLMSASSILRRLLYRGLRARVPSYRIPLTANHQRLRLQWAHVHRAWEADWHQVVLSEKSRFNLWDHDGRIRVRRYAGERCLPVCVIERRTA